MEILERFRPQIHNKIRDIIHGSSNFKWDMSGLASLYGYQMGLCDEAGHTQDLPSGKYMRPILCLSICSALGGDWEKGMGAAAALEIIHRTSLIFDDIQDEGMERNQRPTVWAIWGQNQAINAGLALSSYGRIALQSMAGLIPGVKLIRIMEVLENAVIKLCWGQFRDISMVENCEANVEDYLEMVRGKTGALFGAACEVGALLALRVSSFDNPIIAVNFAQGFGMNLGVAFQMHDDYLGVWGDEARVGKTANDLIEKKLSLPVVLALEIDHERMAGWLRGRVTQKDAKVIADWMERMGIPEKLRQLGLEYMKGAQDKLEALPISPEWRQRLQQFLEFVVKRQL